MGLPAAIRERPAVTTTLRFWKMSGAGNDFIVVDAREPLPAPTGELATALCRRRLGIGADGLLAVRGGDDDRVFVDYRNADGTSADFCGNGARCAARFAVERGMASPEVVLVFPGQEVRANVDRTEVRIEVPRPRILGPMTLASPDGEIIDAVRVDAGVAHIVVRSDGGPPPALDTLRSALLAKDPSLLRQFNVTTAHSRGSDELLVRTLERGSGETLACGSGALAAAAVEPGADEGLRRVVVPPAGIPLDVEIAPAPGPAWLTGDAVIVFHGECDAALAASR